MPDAASSPDAATSRDAATSQAFGAVAGVPLRPNGGGAFGLDVGADTVWVVALDLGDPPAVVLVEVIHPFDERRLENLLHAAAVVAIDAPAARSLLPHLGDTRLPAKFRRARCGEVALRAVGHAVPWVSPSVDDVLPTWMACGLQAWSVAERVGAEAIETFPHAVFTTLAGQRLVGKQQPAGAVARASLLKPLLCTPAWIDVWSHDGLDALAAAYVAWHAAKGTAIRASCDDDAEWPIHDGSAIWLAPAGLRAGAGVG